MFVYTTALVNRGSVKEGEHILKIASELSVVVKSPIMSSRIEARIAEVECRLRQYDKSLKSLGDAEQHLIDSAQEEAKGPDGIEIVRIKGDLFAKQEMAAEAGEMFDIAMSNVQGLELVFNANEALIPSPRKLRASINSALSSMANSRSTPSRKKAGKAREADAEGDGQEVVLPDSIKHVLRQQAWLLREAGFPEDSEEVLAQIKAFCASGTSEVSLGYRCQSERRLILTFLGGRSLPGRSDGSTRGVHPFQNGSLDVVLDRIEWVCIQRLRMR